MTVLLVGATVGVFAGCMTVSSQRSIVENAAPSRTFADKKIAVLPVKAQTSLAPDSVIAIRTEVNRQIGQTLRSKLPSATLIDFAVVSNRLNEKGALSTYEQLVATYENTGVIDRQKTAALGSALGSDYLLLARLKAEKLDIIISRSAGTSLEVSLINAATGEVAWGGSSEWKRGGVFGFGGANPDEAAKALVDLAFSSLHVEPIAAGKAPPSQPAANAAPSSPNASANSPSATPRAESPNGGVTTVLEAQKRLAALGYDPGTADGIMGAKTVAALRRFQADKGLAVSGKLDSATASALAR